MFFDRFDNEQEALRAEPMYIEELREFKSYLREKTEVPELRSLNLLGVQFVSCLVERKQHRRLKSFTYALLTPPCM